MRGRPFPTSSAFDMLLVMGGPQHVWEEDEHPWLVQEKAAIARWVSELGRPCLGVCLGHQLLADALGGTVKPMAVPEIGVNEIHLTAEGLADPVAGSLPRTLPALQWHEAEVVEPPPGALVLARNDYCEVQALRVGPLAWGVQFHLEVGPGTVPKWAAVPEYERTLNETLGSPLLLQEAVEASPARHERRHGRPRRRVPRDRLRDLTGRRQQRCTSCGQLPLMSAASHVERGRLPDADRRSKDAETASHPSPCATP